MPRYSQHAIWCRSPLLRGRRSHDKDPPPHCSMKLSSLNFGFFLISFFFVLIIKNHVTRCLEKMCLTSLSWNKLSTAVFLKKNSLFYRTYKFSFYVNRWKSSFQFYLHTDRSGHKIKSIKVQCVRSMVISHNNISYDIIWTVDIDRTSVEGLLQIGLQEARDQL